MTDDQAWQSLVDGIRKARGDEHVSIHTLNHTSAPSHFKYGGSVYIGTGDKDGATISVMRNVSNAQVDITADADDLRAIAAHCIVAAEEIERDTTKAT